MPDTQRECPRARILRAENETGYMILLTMVRGALFEDFTQKQKDLFNQNMEGFAGPNLFTIDLEKVRIFLTAVLRFSGERADALIQRIDRECRPLSLDSPSASGIRAAVHSSVPPRRSEFNELFRKKS